MKSRKTTSKPRKSRLNPNRYIHAAELMLLDKNGYGWSGACYAIHGATLGTFGSDNYTSIYHVYFDKIFDPCNGDSCYFGLYIDSNREARVLALLLCAELVKDGFKPSPQS